MARMHVFDNSGLRIALRNGKNGFSQEQIGEAVDKIKAEFRNAEDLMFVRIMKSSDRPDDININLEQNSENDFRLAAFNPRNSSPKELFFSVYEWTIREVLNGSDVSALRSTVIHEMTHAIDWSKLYAYYRMLDNMRNWLSSCYAETRDVYGLDRSLYDTLSILNHYRAEGVAILSEILLSGREDVVFIDGEELADETRFIATEVNGFVFSRNSELRDFMIKNLHHSAYHFPEDKIPAYNVASSIILKILKKINYIDSNLYEKAKNSPASLSEEESYVIIRAAISLSISAYVEELLTYDNSSSLLPIRKFLVFCDNLDAVNENKEYIDNFVEMVEKTMLDATNYKKIIGKIMGCMMDDNELQEEYKRFLDNVSKYSPDTDLIQKVQKLYGILRDEEFHGDKTIARWALTYIFDECDVIYDDVLLLGYVDDMMVADMALKLLSSTK